jgi:transcriptional regulator with XRE-family HTH domain
MAPVNTVDHWTGREAKLLRQALRLSIRDFAARLGVGARTVNKWEARQAGITQRPYMQQILDTALAQASEEAKARFTEGVALMRRDQLVLAERQPREADAPGEPAENAEGDPVLAAPWNQRGTVEASVTLSVGGSPVKRRHFNLLTGAGLTVPAHHWLIREPEPLVSGLSGGRISVTLVDHLSPMIATLRAMDDTAGGGRVLALAQHAFGWVAELLDQASYDDHTGRRLHIALAELGQLIGVAATDTGRVGLGQRYHIAALHAAHSADDRLLGAHILACMADQAACHDRPADAVTLIETAVAGIRGGESPRLLAELSMRKAAALATLQDGSACVAALAQADRQVERFEPDSDPRWLYWVTPAVITAEAGWCLLRLGQLGRAATLLEEGTALFDESFARDRQIYLVHLATALARPGPQRDLEAAAERGLAAVRLAECVTSADGIDRLRDLYLLMQPHASVPAVADFLEQARGLLAA